MYFIFFVSPSQPSPLPASPGSSPGSRNAYSCSVSLIFILEQFCGPFFLSWPRYFWRVQVGYFVKHAWIWFDMQFILNSIQGKLLIFITCYLLHHILLLFVVVFSEICWYFQNQTSCYTGSLISSFPILMALLLETQKGIWALPSRKRITIFWLPLTGCRITTWVELNISKRNLLFPKCIMWVGSDGGWQDGERCAHQIPK